MTDLTAGQVGRRVVLRFTLPTRATDGGGITKPLEVQIFRAVQPPGGPAAPAQASSQPWHTLEPAELSRDSIAGKVDYSDVLSDEDYRNLLGSTLSYTVVALTRGFRHRPLESERSAPAAVTLLDVSGPVAHLSVETTEHALVLRWDAPAVTLTGRPVAGLGGYRVYRSEGPNPGERGAASGYRLIAETSTPSAQDPDLQFGREYSYRVAALFKRGTEIAESERSEAVSILPRDTFPPAPPQGVTALYTEGRVELIWNACAAPDLAGYNVYRSEGGGPFTRVNTQPVPTPIYRDASVEPGREYAYRVTAFDTTGNESPPSASIAVETR